MGTKRKKKKRRGSIGGSDRSGALVGLRGGFKGVVGQGSRTKKQSPLSKILSYLLLAAAIGLLIYRFTR